MIKLKAKFANLKLTNHVEKILMLMCFLALPIDAAPPKHNKAVEAPEGSAQSFNGGTFSVANIAFNWISNDEMDQPTKDQIKLQLEQLIVNNLRIAGYLLSRFKESRAPINFVNNVSDKGNAKKFELILSSEVNNSQLANAITFLKQQLNESSNPQTEIDRVKNLFGPENVAVVPGADGADADNSNSEDGGNSDEQNNDAKDNQGGVESGAADGSGEVGVGGGSALNNKKITEMVGKMNDRQLLNYVNKLITAKLQAK